MEKINHNKRELYQCTPLHHSRSS